MTSDPEKTLKEAPRVDLAIALFIHRGHRNVTFIFGLIALIVIWWQDWDVWAYVVPAILLLYAFVRHLNARVMQAELRRRKELHINK